MANLFDRDYAAANKTSFEKIEDIARETRVPVNVLIALGEKAKVDKPEDLVEFSRRAAGELGPAIKGGADIQQIIRDNAGDEADSFLARAREIGTELYPERMNAGQTQRNQEAADQGRRSIGENIKLGIPQVPEGIVGGLGRTVKFLGFDDAGDAIVDFAENTFGMSEEDQARSAAIAEDSTIGQEVIDGFFQAGPGILVDIGMSWAGAKTGARLGAMAGPKGAVVGGVVGAFAGAAASIFPQMVSSAWQTAQANDFDTEDSEVQTRIMATALATSLAQTVFPAAVGRALQKPINVASEGVARSVLQRAAAGAALGSGTEGMAEVTALVLEQIMFDKDVQASLDAEGWKAVGPMLIEKFGREAVVAFGIGALMGGAIGGPAAAVTQRGANTQIEADSAQAQDGAFGAIFERAQDIEPGSIPGVPVSDHSAFMRGILNEINGVEAGLTDAEGNYDAQGRTARQQRAYDKGVAWAREEGGNIADGIKARADERTAQAQAEAAEAPVAAAADEQDQLDLARPAPRPGTLSHAALEGARRAAPVQPNTGAELGVSPQAGMPGGEPQASEASAVAAAPQDGSAGQPVPVIVQFDTDPAPFDAEIVSESPEGVQIMDTDTGEVWNVPREDVEAGMVRITRRDGPASMAPATQAMQGEAIPPKPDQYDVAIQEFGAIADNLTSIGQAERTLADIDTIAREFGEGEDLRAIRQTLERYIEQQEAQQRDAETAQQVEDSLIEEPGAGGAEAADAPPLGELGAGAQGVPDATAQPDIIARPDGTPFKSASALRQKITRDGLDPDAYDITKRDGGFVAMRKGVDPDLDTPQPETATTTEGKQTDDIQQGQQEGLRQQGREEEVTAAQEPDAGAEPASDAPTAEQFDQIAAETEANPTPAQTKAEQPSGPRVVVNNIDADGSGVAQTFADTQIIGGGRGADRPLATEAAVKAAIRKRGQKVEDFDIREISDGFIAVRKTPSPQTDPKMPSGHTLGSVKKMTQAEAPTPAPAQPKPAAGILSVLSQEKQDRAAELKARLAAKARGQTSSGLDPEYISLGGELVALYVEAGIKRFGQMLRDFAETTGLTMREAQAPMRAAYNHYRDDLDLNGESIEGFDSGDQVMAEVRSAIQGEASAAAFAEAETSDTVDSTQQSETPQDDQRSDTSPDRASASEGEGDTAPGRGQADGTRRQSDEQGGPELGLRSDEPGRSGVERNAARDGAAGRTGRTDQQLGARDHIIEAGGLTLARGEKTRARESIAALRVLRTIQAEGRPATSDERAALAKYGGAGTLGGTLLRSDGSVKYPDLAAEIDSLLSEEEKATLSRTSQYAFYTAESALRGMWSLARQLGFSGGRVYEPGMGVGGFAGTIPADVRDRTSYQGLELDHVTAQIAQALYPKQTIQQGDFTKTPLAQNYYDLVIGNPPFSGTRIQNDPAYPQRFMMHDYFFAKSLDAVRPGGLLMFITSAGTMNKSDTAARDYLADRADLVGAIRLPNTAFKENGTEVTTDIIVLRKRLDGETEADATWRESVKTDLPDGDGGTGQAFVNRYFLDNPDMILGEQGLFDKLTAGVRVGVRPKPDADLRADIARATQAFPRDIMSEASPSAELGAIDAQSPETKRGGFYIKDGKLHQFDGSSGLEVARRSKTEAKGLPKADYERVMGLVPIKAALRDVYAADLDGRDATDARKALNKAYDAFVKEFGPINKEVRTERAPSQVQLETARQRAAEDARSRGESFDIGSFDAGPMIEGGAKMAEIARARAEAMAGPDYREGDFDPKSVPDTIIVKRPNIDPFLGNKDRLGDQEGYRLRSIEHYNSETGEAKKSTIFTESAVRRTKQPEINSPEDALFYTLAERGRIDIGAIAKLAKVSEDSVLADLKGKIFRNPDTGQYETRAKYLSGNVRRKLKEAEAAAKSDPAYADNVRDLMDVQPDPIPASEIRVPVGAHWFDPLVYGEYARSKGLQLKASFKRSLGIWTVDGDTKSAAARYDWGTEDIPFADLMRLVMNNRTVQVRHTHKNPDGSTETRLDEEATQAAQDKAGEIRADFSEWFWSDEARAERMESLYNETFNSEVGTKFDGGYLTTPGVNSGWSWRPHQLAVIARILLAGNTYMAHTVGSGKTSAMIGAGMEARRLGLARKPMYVVPNHMLDQFSKEFYEQYPLANVAIADESRFHTSRRKEFVADIAMNDYDAVVITHSAFQLIPPSESAVALVVQDMLKDVREVYDSTESGERVIDQALLGSIKSIAGFLGVDVSEVERAKTNTRKKIEQLLEAAEQKIQRQTSTAKKDQVFTFDEIGVDMMFVDEAHLFRKLSFATQNSNIKGIDPNGSAASMDLFIKTRIVDRNNPGRGLIFASGTPITNTMAELFSLSRYMQPKALEERGVTSFDAWAATFGTTETVLEQDPAGGYKQVSRFSKFLNTPELSLMVRQVMDIVTRSDLEQYVTRPKLKGGKRNLVVVDPSPEVESYQKRLAARMEVISKRNRPVKKGDDIFLSVINDGRLAAIDMRLVDPDASGQGSKLEMAIQNIYRKWQEGNNAALHGVKPEGGYTDKPVMTGPSTQIVFSTLGVNPSKHNPGFSVHRFMKSELMRMGVPADDIVLADDLNSHGKKQRAFNDMNEGKKRILIGSKTLFTGVNAQKRIAAIHNLDPLWYPADDEQRNGRGIRQGNMNPEIEIFDYSTKGTYDATMWQMMGRKASFIEAFYRGDPTVREMEDLGEASQFEQAKAMTTADPRVQTLTDMKAERDTLARRKNAAVSKKRRLEQQERNALRAAETQEAELSIWEELSSRVIETKGAAFEATVDGAKFDSRTDAGNALISMADNMLQDPDGPVRAIVGEVGGFPIQLKVRRGAQTTTFVISLVDDKGIDVGWTIEPVGLMRRLENAVQGIKSVPEGIKADIADYREKAAGYKASREKLKDFADQDRLIELESAIDSLESEMLADKEQTKESRVDDAPTGWGEVEAEPEITPAQMRDITRSVKAELARSIPGSAITAKVVRGLANASGVPIQGRQRGASIEVNPDSADGAVGTLRHEIVHALRDAGLWGQPYGLFSRAEWQGLVAAARADKALMARIDRMYPDLNQTAKLEEGVAELYRLWAGNMDQRSGLDRAFQKMRALFQALASAFRGQGFNGTAQTFERIASGRVGGRGRDGPGGGVAAQAAESRSNITKTKAFRDWFGDSKVVGPDGEPLVAYRAMDRDVDGGSFSLSEGGTYGDGIYLTTDPGYANEFADRDGGQVFPVYVSIQNPAPEALVERIEAEATASRRSSREILKDMGYDGMIAAHGEILAFEPAQIKSVYNRGEFNSNDPRILESRFDPARRPDGKFATKAAHYSRQLLGDGGKITGTKERGLLGNLLTDMMGGKSDRYNTLALVPGEPLFQEMGKHLPSAQKYLKMKHALSAMRNEMQASASKFLDDWRGFARKNQQANDRMMALMHDATIAGLDPAERFTMRPRRTKEGKASYMAEAETKRLQHEELKKRFDRLPKQAQDIYRKVRDGYQEMSRLERTIIMDNVAKAMEINVNRAQQKYDDTLRELNEDGITGDERAEKVEVAKQALMQVKKRDGYGRKARLANLRLMFEQNEVDAPYFPLMRHGNYYATVKNDAGQVLSFSKFETERARDRAVAQLKRDFPEHEIKTGAMSSKDSRAPEVDPNFMADVQAIIGATSADTQLMDSIWQRYLETLPDFSIRKSRLHRKGTPGYSADAFRGYAKQMFHGAFQLSRLKYGQDMQLAIEDAQREAQEASDPTRSTLVVNEMEKRHQWIMNPQTSAWSTWATSAAFVYYLGATPAAAMVNLSQSVIVGMPVLSAAFEKGTIAGAGRHLMRGLREFSMAKGRLLNSKHLLPDEKDALQRAYDAGVIEKSQAHDLSGMQESGVEYSDIRQRMMRPIAYMFHHSERMNREITFIAAYRMAKESGQAGNTAYTNAARLTWKSHFNYESDSRPRLQFNDTVRVMTVFRNYQLNMLYRLFRDSHQMMQGETEADRKEARAQLIGITGMMMLMAGFTGTWGYALMTTLLGLFAEGGADEIEEEIKEGLVNTLGIDVAGMILKGVPGHLAGVDLSNRIGMPELWFRRAQRQEEGQELYDHWFEQLVGAVPAMGSSLFRGASMAKEGEIYRGIETAAPKFVRDYMRSYRYATEGVTTYRGNPIIEDISAQEALTQAIGFTPARISERYQTNRFMKNEEMRIRGQRTKLMAQAYADIKEGKPLSERTKRAITDYNAQYPSYPITADTLRQSFRSRSRGEIETVDGVRINNRLDEIIREGRAPMLYN